MLEDLGRLAGRLRELRQVIRSAKAVNVNTKATRDAAKSVVQAYFREVRPALAGCVEKQQVVAMDDGMQLLNTLALGQNAKRSYLGVLKQLVQDVDGAHFSAVKAESDKSSERIASRAMSNVEDRIHNTLLKMLPSAANAYRQAVVDLPTQRHSYRGPAVDLREALREVLDHMAPDEAVVKSPGYKAESNTNGPTMSQKARFIMKQREISDATARPAVDSTALVDVATSRIVRSTYVSGSVSVHTGPSQAEVQQLKLHVDSVLAQLLGIFT